MTQTPRGFPLFALTDDANIANKLSAISTALDTYLNTYVLSGSVLISPSAPNTPTTVHVTFPTGRFTALPNVVATPLSSNPQQCSVSIAGITTTGVDICFARTAATATTVLWIAVDAT